MSVDLKYGNLETVPLVESVGIRLMSLPKAAGTDLGHGARVSLAVVRRLLGDSKISMPLTDELKQRLAYLLGMASRITKRTKSGKATISEMMEAARQADGERMLVKDFVNIIFEGHVRVRDTKRSDNSCKTYEGMITKQYCLGFAKDWDSMGKVDPVDFVNALAMETVGSKQYVDTQEALQQVFAYSRGIFETPTVENDGYPSMHNFRWNT